MSEQQRQRRVFQSGVAQNNLSQVRQRANFVASGYLNRNRRKPRSRALIDSVRAIDTTIDPAQQEALIAYIRQQYEERNAGQLIGLLSKCFLGAPYVDHELSLVGSIVQHFQPGDQVPPMFGPARNLARNEAYLFVEVYDDGQVVPIRANGEAAI